MPQVVDSNNLLEVTRTGVVPEFKAPETPKPDASPADKPKSADEAKPTDKPADKAESAQPRGEDGKFVKPEQADEGKPKAADEKKPDAEDEDVKLTRKIERIIAKKHRAQKEAEEFATTESRRAIQAEQRAEALQRQIDELQGKKSGGAPAGEGEPKPEDFKNLGEYTRALVKYEAQQAGKKGAAHVEATRQQAQANEVIGRFAERQTAFMKEMPDYEEVLESSDVEVPPITQQYLIESEMGPQLAYHLAKNPEVVTSLRKLSPARQLAELGKLEAKLEKPKEAPKEAAAAKPNGVSSAPAPIQPLEAKSTPVQKDPSQMSFQELRAYRQAEARAKRA